MDELAEEGRLIAETGADLEHHVVRPRLQQIEHHGDHERLRDRLVEADRQRGVLVGVQRERLRDEGVARHPAHGRQHPLVEGRLPSSSPPRST